VSERIVVIGAGINGLVAANYLRRAGFEVTMIERSERVGGACVSEVATVHGRSQPYALGASVLGLMQEFVFRETGLGSRLETFVPDHAKRVNTDFFEPYASISYTIGPVAAKLGGAYAWGGQKGLDFTARSDDSLYVYGELSGGIPRTPLTLKAHLGHTSGSLGRVNPGAGDDNYWDWSLNAEAVLKRHFKLGVSYVDTDISERTFGTPGRHFAQGLGRGATVLGYVGVSF